MAQERDDMSRKQKLRQGIQVEIDKVEIDLLKMIGAQNVDEVTRLSAKCKELDAQLHEIETPVQRNLTLRDRENTTSKRSQIIDRIKTSIDDLRNRIKDREKDLARAVSDRNTRLIPVITAAKVNDEALLKKLESQLNNFQSNEQRIARIDDEIKPLNKQIAALEKKMREAEENDDDDAYDELHDKKSVLEAKKGALEDSKYEGDKWGRIRAKAAFISNNPVVKFCMGILNAIANSIKNAFKFSSFGKWWRKVTDPIGKMQQKFDNTSRSVNPSSLQAHGATANTKGTDLPISSNRKQLPQSFQRMEQESASWMHPPPSSSSTSNVATANRQQTGQESGSQQSQSHTHGMSSPRGHQKHDSRDVTGATGGDPFSTPRSGPSR